MATHIEMQRLSADPAAVRSLARQLLGIRDANWTDWELDFLDSMASLDADRLTMRQREVLVELRDNARTYTIVQGLSVPRLIRECWLARADLDDDDESFVAGLAERGVAALKRRPLLRLLRCCRELGIIDGYIDVA